MAAHILSDPCDKCGKPRKEHPPRGCPKPLAAPAADPSGLRALAASIAQTTTTPPPEERADPSDRWAMVRREADAIEPGHIGTLLWIDARCQTAGMHALDAWHVEDMRRYYASGKAVLAERIGLRGAKSVTKCRALVNDGLFQMRDLDPGTVGVIPIMSADRTEATDRFHTIRAILGACGVLSSKGEDMGTLHAGGLGMEYVSTTLPSGGGVIKTVDSQGHAIEFRIYPARINGAIGYTAIAGLCDEVDLWPVDLGVSVEEVAQRSDDGRANPADVVLDRLLERFTTTLASAHLYIVSASYRGDDSAHARKIDEGDTTIQMVARLGEDGARRDTEARRKLASAIGSTDPRLLDEADPQSTNIPAWVCNPTAPIESCYALSRQRIGPMLGRYGGRPDEAEGVVRGPFGDIEFAESERTFCAVEVVIGAAIGFGTWHLVTVGIDGYTGILRVLRCFETNDPRVAIADMRETLTTHTGHCNVIAVASGHKDRVQSEIEAAYAGGAYVPAYVAAVDVYDAQDLRAGPLLTLYRRERVEHVAGLGMLETALRNVTAGGARVPAAEALAVAVARLTSCYPHLGPPPLVEDAQRPRPPRGALAVGRPSSGVAFDAWTGDGRRSRG